MRNRVFAAALVASALTTGWVATASPSYAQEATANGRFATGVFVKKANMGTPRLSADGNKLAYLMNDNGQAVLAILDLTKSGAKPTIVMAGEDARDSGDRTVGAFRWVGSGHLVVDIAMTEDLGGGPQAFTRLVSYDVGNGKLVQLAWDGAGGGASTILHTNHEKAEILLQRDTVKTSNERYGRPEVVRVDLKTGKYTIVQNINPEVTGWAADSAGVVRAGFSYDGDTGKRRMMYRSTPKDNLVTVMNLADKSFTGGLPDKSFFLVRIWPMPCHAKTGFPKSTK